MHEWGFQLLITTHHRNTMTKDSSAIIRNAHQTNTKYIYSNNTQLIQTFSLPQGGLQPVPAQHTLYLFCMNLVFISYLFGMYVCCIFALGTLVIVIRWNVPIKSSHSCIYLMFIYSCIIIYMYIYDIS